MLRSVKVFGFSLGELTEQERATLQAAITRNQDPTRGTPMVIIAPVGERPPSNDITPYPAAADGVIGVTGTTTDSLALQIRTTGQLIVPTGSFVDVAAPGENILTTTYDPNNSNPHTYSSVPPGAEYAAALVGGAAALIRSVDPTLGQDQVEAILRSTARDLGDAGRDDVYGAGLIDATAAVRATRHFLSVQPNTITLPSTIGANVTLTNSYTLAATWRIASAPGWVNIAPLSDNVSSSSTQITLSRLPSCDELNQDHTIEIESQMPLSYGAIEVPIQVADICQSVGPTPTPSQLTPVPTLTPAAGTPTPEPRSRLFLPLLERYCNSAGDCPEPR